MNEEAFWPCLEYRVTRELSGMADDSLSSLWCDGFIPDSYHFGNVAARIEGRAWICRGRSQEEWEFALVLPRAVRTRDEIPWSSLVPPEDATRWLSIDLARRRIEVEPGAAVPDLD